MPRRKHKKYSKPKQPFNKLRIEEEDALVKKYGLKNKKEIWKAESAVQKIRKQAKLLLTKSEEEKDKFTEKLNKIGLTCSNIADVLGLNKEDYLKRRLQMIVFQKKLSTTPNQARQFIVHKHIKIKGKIMNRPSYMVPVKEESEITLNVVKKEKPKKKTIEEKIQEKESEEIKSEGEKQDA